MLYFDARLSAGQPTVEVRICDVCTDPAVSIALAVLVRALVETAARDWRDGRPVPRWRAEALRVAQWRASRYAMSDSLVDPVLRELRPAREVLAGLIETVGPALSDAGDADRAAALLEHVVSDNGATRQRAAFERGGGVEAVVDDLIERTEQSWDPGDPAHDTVQREGLGSAHG